MVGGQTINLTETNKCAMYQCTHERKVNDMTLKIGELDTIVGLFVIIYDSADKYNHYKIYQKWYDKGWHRKLVEKYADLYSCTNWINNFVACHNEDRR